MAKLSDLIEDFLKKLINEADEEYIEIQRNALANIFKCAPSQINYVLETRFDINNGYVIESRRGSGGYIKIIKKPISKEWVSDIIESIGDSITESKSRMYIDTLYNHNLITDREAKLMKVVLNDKILSVPQYKKPILRAMLFKVMLTELANY
ncbi:CtsR family transcriptional regulator [Aceticella autotrophica]|uniref:Transcriptional regulator CtsR n=1 Tax=Aceticella autotrophica TaxID=2755338 RepID=A0A975AXZ0_9THEO|nr:CtsR family transcriptional regulator [Aceticella autotrophica]QSZ28443.1 CtsR family transcriptional regulator [Aceticella autotrophica]